MSTTYDNLHQTKLDWKIVLNYLFTKCERLTIYMSTKRFIQNINRNCTLHLMCIYCVIYQRPHHSWEIQREAHRPITEALDGRPAEQRPPVESEAWTERTLGTWDRLQPDGKKYYDLKHHRRVLYSSYLTQTAASKWSSSSVDRRWLETTRQHPRLCWEEYIRVKRWIYEHICI